MGFIQSERLNNIFLGDTFEINGKGCFLLGDGKTETGRFAIKDEGREIALNLTCLTREGNYVFGHYEEWLRPKDSEDPIHNRVKINYLIRLLNEKETEKAYIGLELEIAEVDYLTFTALSKKNLMQDFDINTFLPFENEKKIEQFDSLVSNSYSRFLLVPWMNSYEERGKMLKEFLK